MKNSIEEDIKILEEFSNENVLHGAMVGMTLEKYKDLQLSTEHILSDYKRLQEEFKQVDHECDRLEQKEIKLEKENAQLKEDIKEMYFKEVVITIMCDNFSLSRNEALELLGDEE